MTTIEKVTHLGRVGQLAIGLAAVFMLHWSLKTVAPALTWLEEPSFVQSLAAAIAIVAAGVLLNLTRSMGPGRREHDRRSRKPWDPAASTATEAKP
jgi:protein-S-isoprenylcysteine O-methyltransferase Ste14